MSDLQDLELLGRILVRSTTDVGGIIEVNRSIVAVAEDALVDDVLDLESEVELHELQVLGFIREPQKRQFDRQSWGLMHHARAVKRIKGLTRDVGTATRKLQYVSKALTVAVHISPNLSVFLGLSKRSLGSSDVLDSSTRAEICLRVALGSRASATTSQQRSASNRSVYQVAACLLDLQRECRDRLFLSHSKATTTCIAPLRIKSYSAQWDETSQKMTSVAAFKFGKGVRHSKGAVSMQTMMASGTMCSFVFEEKVLLAEEVEPWFVRARVLQGQTGDHILEGLLREFPVPIENKDEASRMMSTCDVFLLSLGADRAAANDKVLAYIWDQIHHDLPLCILPHVEPCGAHGVALVKGRSTPLKAVTAAAHSLTRLLRIQKNIDGIRASVLNVVSGLVRVRRMSRPAIFDERAQSLIDSIFGDDESKSYLYHVGHDGSLHKSQFLLDIEDLCSVINLGEHEGEDHSAMLVHWCCVKEGTDRIQNGIVESGTSLQ
jgi:hypothetical protein